MIYVDRPQSFSHKRKKYSHMLSDTSLDELHSFASNIGVKRHWFDKDHYDLREFEYEKAIEAGALRVPTTELVKVRRKIREVLHKCSVRRK